MMKMKCLIWIVASLIMSSFAQTAYANDGVYYARGSQLVPIHETDIAVKKEVLTITLGDDGIAYVDVDYTFENTGEAKTVEMGFEASKPYNTGDTVNSSGVHPYIHNFTVTMNGESLPYKNATVIQGQIDKPYSGPFNVVDEDGIMQFAYAYCFQAPFQKGLNKVHHTYQYKMSFGVGRTFEVPYWLTPATRWKGGSIGDFTLIIRADKTAKHFCLEEKIFEGAEFKVIEGTGKIRHHTFEYGARNIEIAIRNGAVEWHKYNFSPKEDMNIVSADAYTSFGKNMPFGTFYDRSDRYVIWTPDRNISRRIARNLPYANRGYVFKDKKLQKYFNQFFWYMPDPNWKQSTEDFTPREWKLINSGK